MAEVLTPDAVTETLRRWASTRLVWGESDCAMSVFIYLADHHGVTGPRDRWRGRYHDEAGAKAHMRALGGPVRAFQAEALHAGLTRTHAPRSGDVGLVRDGDRRLVAAICLGDGRWAARVARGFCVCAFDHIVAYRVEAGHG